jgi:hypothetical protein
MLPSSASELEPNSQRLPLAGHDVGRRETVEMDVAALAKRVEMLEETVESLKRLPDRVGALEVRVDSLASQVLQLRTEMRDGFSAIEGRMATKDDLTRMATKDDLAQMATRYNLARMATKDDLAELGRELREEMSGAVREMAGFVLATERRLLERIPVLVEDVLSRIAIRNEGNPGTP